MITVDEKELRELERDFQTFAARAYPFATRNTLNTAAFAARTEAQGNIRKNMTTRNQWTERSVQVDRARSLDVSRQVTRVGSPLGYMEDQEFGGTKRKKGKYGVPIATSYSAGLPENAKPRTRMPRRPNRLPNIRLRKRPRQSNAAIVREAAKAKQRYVFMDLGRRKGIFRIVGGVRRPRVKMVYDLSRSTVPIPRNPWLAPAVATVERQIPAIHRDSLIYQAQRHRLFGY